MKSTLADLGQPAPRYLQAAAVTNEAYLKFGAARRAFAEFLNQRDLALTAKYPNWQTWWALMTCPRHPSTEHLDFDMAVED